MAQQSINGKTTILKEYSLTYSKDNYLKLCPYYPIVNENNLSLYQQYVELVNAYPRVSLSGRLPEYKYYNMDVVIKKAFELVNAILKQN